MNLLLYNFILKNDYFISISQEQINDLHRGNNQTIMIGKLQKKNKEKT